MFFSNKDDKRKEYKKTKKEFSGADCNKKRCLRYGTERIIDVKSNKQTLFKVLIGSLAGLANGLFGGGGGMIVVPMLIFLMKYKEKQAHATAIMIILPLSVTSGLLYSSFGFVDLSVLLPTMFGVIAGGVVGAIVLKKINSTVLLYVFCAVMVIAGLKMAFL